MMFHHRGLSVHLQLATLLIALVSAPNALAQGKRDDIVREPPVAEGETDQRPGTNADRLPAEPLASLEEQEHLGMWIEYVSGEARRNRLTSGSSMLVGSALGIGFGIPLYLQSNPGTELNKGIGISLITFSGVLLAVGITELATKTVPEKRLAQWKEATESALTLRELARFEGELRGYSDVMRREMLRARWTNFGMGLTGALILGLTPAANLSKDAATIGYVVGGVMAGLGFMGFAFSFRKGAVPDYWSAYLRGKSPPAGGRWSVAPSAGYKYAGARVLGRF